MTFRWSCLANCSNESDCPFCIWKQSTVWGQRWYYSFPTPLCYFFLAPKAHWQLGENSCQPSTYLSAHYVRIGSWGLMLFTYGSVQTPFPLGCSHFLNIMAISSLLFDISSQTATHDLNLLSPLTAKFTQSSYCHHSFLLFTSSLVPW